MFYLILVFLLLGFRIAVSLKNRQFNKMMIPSTRKIRVTSVPKSLDIIQSGVTSKTILNELVIEEVDEQ